MAIKTSTRTINGIMSAHLISSAARAVAGTDNVAMSELTCTCAACTHWHARRARGRVHEHRRGRLRARNRPGRAPRWLRRRCGGCPGALEAALLKRGIAIEKNLKVGDAVCVLTDPDDHGKSVTGHPDDALAASRSSSVKFGE